MTPQEVLLVRGPGRVVLVAGVVTAVGLRLESGIPVVVRKNKVVPFEAESSEATITLSLSDEGDYGYSRAMVGMKPWRDIAAQVLSTINRKVVVIGESDSGKSTFSAYLINSALQSGRRVGIVDGDVGQGDLAPPCAIGASMVSKEVSDLRDVPAETLAFVGATSPRGFEGVLNEEIRQLNAHLERAQANLILVNTDGYVREAGADHKISLTHALQADCAVCLGSEPTTMRVAAGIYSSLPGCEVISAPSPREVVKSSLERAERRITQYGRFLTKRRRVVCDWEELELRFRGVRYRFDFQTPLWIRFAAAEGKTLWVRRDAESFIEWDARGDVVFSSTALAGMFVGLGRGGRVSGFGVLVAGPFSKPVAVETPLQEAFDEVHLSTVTLTDDLREERVIPWFSHPNIG